MPSCLEFAYVSDLALGIETEIGIQRRRSFGFVDHPVLIDDQLGNPFGIGRGNRKVRFD